MRAVSVPTDVRERTDNLEGTSVAFSTLVANGKCSPASNVKIILLSSIDGLRLIVVQVRFVVVRGQSQKQALDLAEIEFVGKSTTVSFWCVFNVTAILASSSTW